MSMTHKLLLAFIDFHPHAEELAEHTPVPVLNSPNKHASIKKTWRALGWSTEAIAAWKARAKQASLPLLGPLTIANVADSANVLHDVLVTYPRLGHNMRLASPRSDRARGGQGVDAGVVTDTWYAVPAFINSLL